jgi:hypothetical protein
MSDDNTKLDLSNAKIKIDNRSRGRMKITIKLSKEEAESYKNMKAALLPSGQSDDLFVKSVFFMGLEQFHNNAITLMQKYVEENQDKLREEGVDVDSILNNNPEKSE